MSFDAEGLFSKLQKKQEEQAAAKMSAGVNPNILKLKVNNNYSFRLLWLPPFGNCKREYPMINQYIHFYWDNEAANGEKNNLVYCPTSQYLLGSTKKGFDACPVCTEAGKLYNKGKGSESAKRLYSTFKRRLTGYIPVYVVNGPKEDVGQIKILKYGKSFWDFFNLHIFGIPAKDPNGGEPQPINPEEIVGLEAFMYEKDGKIVTEGCNFNVTVTSRKVDNGKGVLVDMPHYDISFSHRTSTITDFNGEEITPEKFTALNEELGFDNEFFMESSPADLKKFALKFLSAGEAVSEDEEEEVSPAPSMNPYNKGSNLKTSTPPAPTPAAVPKKTMEVKVPDTPPATTNGDDIDIDSLIKNL